MNWGATAKTTDTITIANPQATATAVQFISLVLIRFEVVFIIVSFRVSAITTYVLVTAPLWRGSLTLAVQISTSCKQLGRFLRKVRTSTT